MICRFKIMSFADKLDAEIIMMHAVSQDIALDYLVMVAQATTRLLEDASVALDKLVVITLLQINTNTTLKNVSAIQPDFVHLSSQRECSRF